MARLHSSSGRFVGWTRLPNALLALYQSVLRKACGRIPRQPWIPYAARKELQRLIGRDWTVWEVGAGYSTLWFAGRVGHLTSIESSRQWHDRVAQMLAAEGTANVDLRFEWVAERMADFTGVADGSLDLLFIDGGPRDWVLRNGFAKVKKGGHIYLDNWDCPDYWETARACLSSHRDQIASERLYVDYVPAQVGVYEGLLIRKAG